LLPLDPLTPAQVQALLDEGANALDVRPGEQFAAGHVPGSIGIALSGQFASWAGGILGIHSKPILVADSDEQIEEARMRLARVGIEEVGGFLAGGFAAWQKAGMPVLETPEITVQELQERLRAGGMAVLDVRREGEWRAGHIEQADWRALDTFPHGLPPLDRNQPIAVHCKSGYRSLIACSLLERAGHRNVINVTGGFDAWHAAGLPEVEGELVKA
jgi:hydroxyacylglutathione hydrolase